ncbi:plasmid stabilization protein [Rhodoferax sediminis]|uniref:plasmid stabilization protein n=1 Tax=Rhodoferax sediminis TaxID=2509614 RepID=UPI0030843B99
MEGIIMSTNPWSPKRERQYAHIKESLFKPGKGAQLAGEIAARTVNKERAQHGEAEQANASSLNDVPAGRRGGRHSHLGAGGRTLVQLRNEARQRGVKGRSRTSEAQPEQPLNAPRRINARTAVNVAAASERPTTRAAI